jgi:hypothetical protein
MLTGASLYTGGGAASTGGASGGGGGTASTTGDGSATGAWRCVTAAGVSGEILAAGRGSDVDVALSFFGAS